MSESPKRDNWKSKELNSGDLDLRLLFDPQRVSSDGAIRKLQTQPAGSSDSATPQGIRFANPLPLVDVHCHLVADYAATISKPSEELLEQLSRHNFWRQPGADRTVSFSCLLDETPQREIEQFLSDHWPQIARFLEFGVLNGLVDNLPQVLDAPRSFGSTRDPNSTCWSTPPSICVPLALDLAYTPIFAADPEGAMSSVDEIALSEAHRFLAAERLANPEAEWLQKLDNLDGNPTPKYRLLLIASHILAGKPTEKLKAWAQLVLRTGAAAFPAKSFHVDGFYADTSLGYTLLDAKCLDASLESFSYVAKGSRATVMPFLPFEPRRWSNARQVKSYLEKWLTTSKSAGKGFVGLKFYTRCGWKLWQNEQFYPSKGATIDANVDEALKFAENSQIPITNHHSPAGWPPKELLVPPIGYSSGKNNFYNSGEDDGRIPLHQNQTLDTSEGIAEAIVWHAATEVASYCDYVNRTASPSIWRTALKQYPSLRVNLAHAGTMDAAILHYFGDSVVSLLCRKALAAGMLPKELAGEWSYLIDHPMIAPTRYFADLFWLSVQKKSGDYSSKLMQQKKLPARFTIPAYGIDELMNKVKAWEFSTDTEFSGGKAFWGSDLEKAINPSMAAWHSFTQSPHQHLSNAIGLLRTTRNWNAWVNREQRLGWYGETLELSSTYEHVYFDLSYFASDRQKLKWILHYVLRDIFDCHPSSSRLAERAMLGTDWFLTERDLGSAHAFWKTFQEAFEEAGLGQREWDLLTSRNAIRFLGIQARHEQLKTFFTDKTVNRYPPPWFAQLAKDTTKSDLMLRFNRKVDVVIDTAFTGLESSVSSKETFVSFACIAGCGCNRQFEITNDIGELDVKFDGGEQPFSIPLVLNKTGQSNSVFLSRPPTIPFAFERSEEILGIDEELICFELDETEDISAGEVKLSDVLIKLAKNKFVHDVLGSSSHIQDSYEALLQFGNNSGYIKVVQGKRMLIIRGYAGRRETIGGFLRINRREVIKVMKSWSSVASQAQFAKLSFGFDSVGLSNVKAALRSNSISILAFASIDAFQELQKDRSVWTDIGVTFASGIVQGVIGAAATFAGSAGIFTLASSAAIAAPIWAVSLGAFAVSVGVSYGLRWLDEELELTENAKQHAKAFTDWLNQLWEDEVEKPTERLLNRLEQEILWLYFPNGI